jgi:hypothetical protein
VKNLKTCKDPDVSRWRRRDSQRRRHDNCGNEGSRPQGSIDLRPVDVIAAQGSTTDRQSLQVKDPGVMASLTT